MSNLQWPFCYRNGPLKRAGPPAGIDRPEVSTMIGQLSARCKPANALPVAVAAVIGQPGILLIRRRNPPFVGHWGLPGGKIQTGEHLDQAVRREVLEETGVRARFECLCGVVTEFLYEGPRLAMHYLLLVCRLSPLTGQLRSSSEGTVRWFPLSRVRDVANEVIPSDRLMLERLVFCRPRNRYFRCVVRKTKDEYRVVSFR